METSSTVVLESTALLQAASRDDTRAVQAFLQANVTSDINQADSNGWTLLHWAAYHGNMNLVHQLLLAGGAVCAITTSSSSTPLHLAASEGNLDVVKALLEAGASPFSCSHPCEAPSQWGSYNEAAIAEAAGFGELNINVFRECRPVDLAAVARNIEVVRVLLDAMDIAGQPSRIERWDILRTVILAHDVELVEFLIDQGIDIECQDDESGWRPIHWAAVFGDLHMTRVLLDRGADPLATTGIGLMPIDIVAEIDPYGDFSELRRVLLNACKEI